MSHSMLIPLITNSINHIVSVYRKYINVAMRSNRLIMILRCLNPPTVMTILDLPQNLPTINPNMHTNPTLASSMMKLHMERALSPTKLKCRNHIATHNIDLILLDSTAPPHIRISSRENQVNRPGSTSTMHTNPIIFLSMIILPTETHTKNTRLTLKSLKDVAMHSTLAMLEGSMVIQATMM